MTTRRWILVLAAPCWFAVAPALAAPGDLDPTFADKGVLRSGFGSVHNAGYAIAAQADGKLVVAGECVHGSKDEFTLFRYNLDGSLDTSFDRDGKVLTSFGWGSDSGKDMAIQADGKIIAVGYTTPAATSISSFAVARYHPDGSLDESWDGDGKATVTDIVALEAYSVAVQGDGKVVVAGVRNPPSSLPDGFAVARFNPDGSRDLSFGGTGLVITDLDHSRLGAVTIQPDGKILTVGYSDGPDGHDNDQITMVRYLNNGALDPAFDGDGIAIAPGPNRFGYDVAISDHPTIDRLDRIIVAGEIDGPQDQFGLFAFNMSGSVDSLFGVNGKVTGIVGASSSANAVHILYSLVPPSLVETPSRILFVGHTGTNPRLLLVAKYLLNGDPDVAFGGGDGNVTTNIGPQGGGASAMTRSSGKIAVAGLTAGPNYSDQSVVVARYNADGSLDMSFDGDGFRIDEAGGRVAVARAAAIQTDGKVVVAGSTQIAAGDDDFAVMRLNPDGTLDPSFGPGGSVTTRLGAGSDIVHGVAIQSDGRIVVVGESGTASNSEVALARYMPDGALDLSFSGDGIQVTAGGAFADVARAVALQPDGKIVVAGVRALGGASNLAVMRYLPDGTLEFVVTTTLGLQGAIGNAVVCQPDGKLFAAGKCWEDSGESFAAVRLLPNGGFDASFGGDGTVVTPVGGGADARAALLRADGRIVVAGSSFDGTFEEFALVRYLSDGSLDPSFAGDGIATYSVGPGSDQGRALALQPNGKLVIAGTATEGTNSDFALLRLLDDGAPDPFYGNGGIAVVDLDGGSPDAGYSMAIDGNGSAVVAGDAGGLFGVVRVLGDVLTSVFNGLSNHAMGGASLIQDDPDTLRVTGIGSFGADGVRIALPEGITTLRTWLELPNEPTLPAGAHLEISSRARGSAPGESLGFTRITRLSTPGQYAVTGAIAGAGEKVVALYQDGVEVYRDRRPASPSSAIATLPACLACKLAANDDLGTTPLSPLVLRWLWSDNDAITISNRPNGAPDTTVTGDELRILEPDATAGDYRELSEFLIRGKDLGEIRILSEETRTAGVGPEPLPTRALWFAQPSPNPSRDGFGSFAFRLGKADLVSIEISDVAGRRLAQRPAESFSAGSHVVRWPQRANSPGIYFVRVATGSGEALVRKWVVLR